MSMWGDMPAHKLVSPNEMYAAAVNEMLDGNNPVTKDDYALIVNFMAANLIPDTALAACQLMGTIFQMPLSPDDIKDIVEFQLREYS
jgi:hypothetical protein